MEVIEDIPVRYSRRLFDQFPGDATYAQAIDKGERVVDWDGIWCVVIAAALVAVVLTAPRWWPL